MKIFTDGAMHFGGQLPRIQDGFRQLGHEITPYPHDASLIYSNDSAHYHQIVVDRAAGRLRGKVIFTCLDVPVHLGTSFDYEALGRDLRVADAICSISTYGQTQLREIYGLDSTIVYQPIKPVGKDSALKVDCPYRFASIGRRYDPNKNAAIWVAALEILGIARQEVALVGSEAGWGDYLGVLRDDGLNHLYNSVDFVLALGTNEGLNLPVLESMACGVIPVIHRGLTTREELLPAALFPEYLEVDLTPQNVALFIAKYLQNSSLMEDMKSRLYKHYQEKWSHLLTPQGVASQILMCYENTRNQLKASVT